MREKVLNGSKPSTVTDSGSSSSCERMEDTFIPRGIPSDKVFKTSLGQVSEATEQRKLMHMVREPARTVGMV